MIGWIKVHRKIWEWPHSRDPEYISVWLFLLTHATHKKYDTIFDGERITLQSGQLITSRKSIVDFTKVNRGKVERILKTLKNEQQIVQQTSNKNRLISICNWQLYQECVQQVCNKRATSVQQVCTNKNVNNIKNEKNDKNDIYAAREKKKDSNQISLEQFYEKEDQHDFKADMTNYMMNEKGYDRDIALLEFEAFESYWLANDKKYKNWGMVLKKWVTSQYSRLSKNTHTKQGSDYAQKNYSFDGSMGKNNQPATKNGRSPCDKPETSLGQTMRILGEIYKEFGNETDNPKNYRQH